MQKMNRLKVLDFVRKNPDSSRPQIAKKTGLSLASITNITTYLLDLGLLVECGTEKVGRVGRKSTLLRFCATNYDLICVYLNEKYMNIAYTDLEGKPIEKIRVETEGLSPEDTTDELCANIHELLKKHSSSQVLGIGVAISGLVLDDSRFIFSSRLKWKSLDVKKALEKTTNIPVFVNNVSFLKAVWYFSKKTADSHENMLFVDMENGIGAVQYANGSIFKRTLGEIGHTTVEKDGDSCFCGNKGCLEAMCSPKKLMQLYEKASKKSADLKEINKLYKKEDEAAVSAVASCGEYLGIGLATLVNLFNPSVMVINSGDFEDCPSLLIEAEKVLRQRAYPSLTQKLSIKQINETEENTIYGTAFDLCNSVFDISFGGNIVE